VFFLPEGRKAFPEGGAQKMQIPEGGGALDKTLNERLFFCPFVFVGTAMKKFNISLFSLTQIMRIIYY